MPLAELAEQMSEVSLCLAKINTEVSFLGTSISEYKTTLQAMDIRLRMIEVEFAVVASRHKETRSQLTHWLDLGWRIVSGVAIGYILYKLGLKG